MKYGAMAILMFVLASCDYHFENPHLGPRGLTEEFIKAPPGGKEIKAAIINDIRNRRALQYQLAEGRRTPPDELKFDQYGVEAIRIKDEFPLWRVTVRTDPADKLYAVSEYAYWDDQNFTYYYHYEGGNPHRDVWMGPYEIKFKKPPDDEP